MEEPVHLIKDFEKIIDVAVNDLEFPLTCAYENLRLIANHPPENRNVFQHCRETTAVFFYFLKFPQGSAAFSDRRTSAWQTEKV